jgi:hypothetical protein
MREPRYYVVEGHKMERSTHYEQREIIMSNMHMEVKPNGEAELTVLLPAGSTLRLTMHYEYDNEGVGKMGWAIAEVDGERRMYQSGNMEDLTHAGTEAWVVTQEVYDPNGIQLCYLHRHYPDHCDAWKHLTAVEEMYLLEGVEDLEAEPQVAI